MSEIAFFHSSRLGHHHFPSQTNVSLLLPHPKSSHRSFFSLDVAPLAPRPFLTPHLERSFSEIMNELFPPSADSQDSLGYLFPFLREISIFFRLWISPASIGSFSRIEKPFFYFLFQVLKYLFE